jgi:hypothetical protein
MKEFTFTDFKLDQTVERLDVVQEMHDDQLITIIENGNWKLEFDQWRKDSSKIDIHGFYKGEEKQTYEIDNRGNFTIKVLDDDILILDCNSKEDNYNCIICFHKNVVDTRFYCFEYNLYSFIDERYIVLLCNEADPFIIDCFLPKVGGFNNRKDNVYADDMGEPYDYKNYHEPFEHEPTEYLNISFENDNSSFKVLLKRKDNVPYYDENGWAGEDCEIYSYEYTFAIDYTGLRLLLTDCRDK